MMLEPIHIEHAGLLVHSFRAEEIKGIGSVAEHVYDILSDEDTLRFLPEKRLSSVNDAETFLKGSLLRFHAGKNYLHFISNKKSGKVIGMIDVIPPETAMQHYDLKDYPYFIEFYLKASSGRKKVMSSVLPLFMEEVKRQRIRELAAITNRENIGAQKVLLRSGFDFRGSFDSLQDFYTIIFN
ncbi:Protein N-acetyltransferase, RimJ/RimL family [Mucilaginibacter pineti]|uniref:Protein N-acetyltransferase, RimJ/RimL family n=1 Tax=Mucilaginibacter pineti TaxID=1391627 RepID=A0A1G7GG29_9SPHI|nr:GNAT family N-acetyltransferase [Mucilaginibacter pineti]SDE87112.1 Protein N-acetyltransferase, RimJ/RimL family [Mucilaginibacter pineti]